MAVAFEGFSIREFASKMRSVDVVKSWPFDGGDSDREQIQSSLPPITVAKFRWWQHELDAARSSHASSSDAANLEEGVEKSQPRFGCTVCGGFKTSFANEIAAENCERQQPTRARSKTKAPKKRSIVEIFAVAPPIDTVTRQEGSSDGRNSDSARVKKKKKKKNAVLKKRRLPILDRKLKKKVRINSSFAIKEIGHKLKRKTASDLSRNFDRLRDKMCTGGTLDDADGISRRKPKCKPSSSHKKHKNIASSNFTAKKHKAVSPIRSILKKPGKSCASGQDTAFTVPGISQKKENSRVIADQLEKHVRFSVEKDKIDGKANAHAVTQQSNVHEKILSGMDRLGRNEVESVSGDVTGCGSDISNCLDTRKELQADMEKETLPDTCDRGNLKNLEVTFQQFLNSLPPVVSTSPNQIPKFSGDLNNACTKGKSIVSDDSIFLSTSRGTHHGASSEFINQQMGPSHHAVYGMSSSVPSFVPPLYRPASRPHQMNLIGGFFPFNEWRPAGATSAEKRLNDNNLYGLPLNSRGELIQLSSSGNFTQSSPSSCLPLPCQTSVNAEDSIRLKRNHTDERPRPKDLDLFPGGTVTDFSQENSSHLFGTDLNLMSPYSDQVHHGKGKMEATAAPMTMRLMGKDVSVRGGSEDEKVWTDKEIIVEHNPSGTAHGIKNFFPQDQILHSVPEKPRGLVNISFGCQNNSEHYRVPHRARVRDPYINWQPDATVQIGRGTVFHIENLRNPYTNERLMFPHEGNWIDIQWGAPELRFLQNVPVPGAPSSFGYPPDCRECVQESWSQNNSCKEVPPWFLNASRALPPFPDRQHLYGSPRWSSSTTQPTFHFPEPACCPYNPMAVRPMSEPVSAFGFRDHMKASKRPAAAVDVDLRKPHKVPTLELEHPRIDLCLSREDIGWTLDKGKETNIGLGVLERNVRTSTNKPGPGPTKLSAGVKHILKPCQNTVTDKGSSKPTHSAIPLAGVNTK